MISSLSHQIAQERCKYRYEAYEALKKFDDAKFKGAFGAYSKLNDGEKDHVLYDYARARYKYTKSPHFTATTYRKKQLDRLWRASFFLELACASWVLAMENADWDNSKLRDKFLVNLGLLSVASVSLFGGIKQLATGSLKYINATKNVEKMKKAAKNSLNEIKKGINQNHRDNLNLRLQQLSHHYKIHILNSLEQYDQKKFDKYFAALSPLIDNSTLYSYKESCKQWYLLALSQQAKVNLESIPGKQEWEVKKKAADHFVETLSEMLEIANRSSVQNSHEIINQNSQ
jgi:hypothetical protein